MTEPLTYSIEQAAQRLGSIFTVSWLAARVKRHEIPCIRTGEGRGRAGRVGFSEEHLRQIVTAHSVPATPSPDPHGMRPVTRRRAS